MILFICVSLLGMFAGLYGIWKDYKTADNFYILLGLSICLIGSLIYNGYDHYQTLKKEKYIKTWGTFNFFTGSNAKPTLWKGMIANTLVLKNDEWPSEDTWEAWSENGKVNLNGTVRDRDGNIVFQIIKTDWKNWSAKDFNYDERAIEVKDSKGNIILQLEFNKDENKINLSGILYYGSDRLLLMGKEVTKTVIGNSPSANAEISSFIKSMKPIFKYPREEHLGERV